jgi:hypothetical protein
VRIWGYQMEMNLSQRGPAYPRKTAVVEIADHDFWGPDFAGREQLRYDRIAESLDRLRHSYQQTRTPAQVSSNIDTLAASISVGCAGASCGEAGHLRDQ